MRHELDVSAGLAGAERHPHRVEHEISAHVGGELPANDHAGEHVDQEREVQAALPGAQVGEVADPQAVGRGRGEVPIDEIWQLVRLRIRDRGPPRLPSAFRAADALLAHQPGDLVTAGGLALPPQLMPHPPVPVALEVLLMHGPDPTGQPLVLDATC
jgi:hypothetical protein